MLSALSSCIKAGCWALCPSGMLPLHGGEKGESEVRSCWDRRMDGGCSRGAPIKQGWALSRWVLKCSKDGDCTVPLGNIFQFLSILMVKTTPLKGESTDGEWLEFTVFNILMEIEESIYNSKEE